MTTPRELADRLEREADELHPPGARGYHQQAELLRRAAAMLRTLADQQDADRKDAERWRAMRKLLIAVDWSYGDPPMSIAAFELKANSVMAGPEGADAIADAARAQEPKT